MIETITCLAKFVNKHIILLLYLIRYEIRLQDIDRVNLTSLWGKHEKLLNNLQMRFEMVLVTDLYEYFKEPWTCAIYHDRFTLLEKDIQTLLTSFTVNR